MDLEHMSDEQFERLLKVEDRRLALGEQELRRKDQEYEARAKREEIKDALWEKHVETVEEHNRITHGLLDRIAVALERKAPE